jgi:hypothetical protein
MTTELEALHQHAAETSTELSRTEGRIAELENKPARAAFKAIVAGDSKGDVHDAYLAMRAEEYRSNGGRHYDHEKPEDRLEIERRAVQS